MSFKYSSINFEIAFSKSLFFFRHLSVIARSGSRAAATSKMERFVIISQSAPSWMLQQH